MPCNGVAVVTAKVDLQEHDHLDLGLLESVFPSCRVFEQYGLAIVEFANPYDRIEIGKKSVHIEARTRQRKDEMMSQVRQVIGMTFQKQLVTFLQTNRIPIVDATETDDMTIVLAVKLNGRRARVAAALNGELMIMTEEGDFARGSKDILDLLNNLKASGVNFKEVGRPEQHRHDDHEHAHTHAHQKRLA